MKLRSTRRRDGTVAVIAAVCLVAILSVVALSLDGGTLMDKRRQAQAAADAAALAAGAELYVNWFTTHGLDTADGSAVATAKAAAAANGFVDGQNGCTVTVNIPPLSGPFAGQKANAEVIISYPQKRYFSRLFGTDDVTIGARAVGRGKRSSINTGILVLDPSKKDALSIGGNGAVQITGSANVIVNSTNSEGMIANGTGASISATEFDLGGNPGWASVGGATITGPILSNQEPTPDPLALLPVPDPTTMTVQTNGNGGFQKSNGDWTLSPGVYNGGISIGGQASATLLPGIYYMNGGGFSFTGQGTLLGNGVMIYNAPTSTSDKVSLSGQGNITLSPPTSGTYQGVLIFQDRASTAPINISGSNAVSMSISGAFYAVSGQLNVSGNGTQQTLGSQYISNTAVVGGNGGFTVNWDPGQGPGTREVWLVE